VVLVVEHADVLDDEGERGKLHANARGTITWQLEVFVVIEWFPFRRLIELGSLELLQER